MGELVLAAAGLLSAAGAQALVISAGSPITMVPDHIPAVLGAEQFLLPIEVREAADLQDWSFDLAFDPAVVRRVDPGGFYDGMYAAQFSAAQPALSSIVSSGLLLDGQLVGVAGFSGGVSGDGLLAYIAFEFLAPGQDPGFEVGNVPLPIPEPGTVALMVLGLALLTGRRGRIHGPAQEST
nr:PEP-CTERM sorting domain-containing protein [Variovorax boronicumulans]